MAKQQPKIENDRGMSATNQLNTIKKRRNHLRRFAIVMACIFVFFTCVWGVLGIGSVYTDKTWEFWYADYQKQDITLLLEKDTLTAENYETLYRQTGLGKVAIDDMRTTVQGRGKILRIQDNFFIDHTVVSRRFAPFTYMDEIEGMVELADLKDGDIIVSATTRVSWWRYGHAALVVDGENGIVLECTSPQVRSEYNPATDFCIMANFLVLRPKAVAKEMIQNVVAYANEYLVNLKYHYTTGIFSTKFPKKLEYTQCAHLVWYAYKKFGIDLDSNGGRLVKPQDIANSDQLQLVQSFGYDLDKLWK